MPRARARRDAAAADAAATAAAAAAEAPDTPRAAQSAAPEPGATPEAAEPASVHRHSPRRIGRSAALLLASDSLMLDGVEIHMGSVEQLAELGSGAFGRVCECAIDGKRTGLAMKLVETTDEDVIRDSEAEFQVMEKLSGVSRFLMYGRGGGRTLDNRFVLFMDYMPGGTLLRRIKQAPLDEPSARFYAAAMVLGLETLHDKRILHRDVKPENVLIDYRGYPKLADFGYAKSVNVIEGEDVHTVVGTAQYWPPEVASLSEQDANQNGARYSKGLDLWALGVTLFNCITGKRAFMSEGMDSLSSEASEDYEDEIYESIMTYAQQTKEVGSTIALWNRRQISQLSEEVRSLVEQLLSPEPSQRLGMASKGGYARLRKHKWFDGFDWAALKAGKLAAPWIPPWDPESGLPNPNPPAQRKKTVPRTLVEAMNGACDELSNLTTADGRQIAWIFCELPDKNAYPDYYDLIDTPVCLNAIQKKVQSKQTYTSWTEFELDIETMFKNARIYNLPGSAVCQDADRLQATFRKYKRSLPAAIKVGDAASKSSRPSAPSRPEATKTAASRASAKQKQKQKPLKDAGRDSQKRLEKRLKDAMRDAWKLLCGVTDANKRPRAGIFLELPSKELYPDYFKMIKKPISLRILKEKIESTAYSSWKLFEKDLRLVFENAFQYNVPESQVCIDAKALELAYQNFAAKVPQQVKKVTITSLQVDVASGPTDRTKSVKQLRTAAMMKMCDSLCAVVGDRGRNLSEPFIEWPDNKLYPDYFRVIKLPMCFRRVREKIKTSSYKSWKSFEKDVLRIFENARQYNVALSQVAMDADVLEAKYRQFATDVSVEVLVPSTHRNRSKSQMRTEAMLAAWEVLCGRTSSDGRVLAEIFIDLPARELYPDYYDLIKRPMSLRLIKQNVDNGAYSKWKFFEEDLLIMFENARKYNPPDSQVCLDAAGLQDAYTQYVKNLPANVKAEDMLDAWEVLCGVRDQSGRSCAGEFMDLPARELYMDYYVAIKKPMCLRLIKDKIERSAYTNLKAMEKDVVLMISNARSYNAAGSQICQDAAALERAYKNYTKDLLAADSSRQSAQPSRLEKKTQMKSLKQMREEAMTGACEVLCALRDSNNRLVAGAFMDWPDRQQCPDYFSVIKQAMCFNRIKEKITNSTYNKWDAFDKDVMRIFENAHSYNPPGHWVCTDAELLKAAYLEYVGKVPSHVRGRRAGNDGGTSTGDSVDARVLGSASTGQSLTPEQESMLQAWQTLCNAKDSEQSPVAGYFMELVSKELYPDYYRLIRKPMSLRVIKEKLDSGRYATWALFERDVRLIVSNAKQFNPPESAVVNYANLFEAVVNECVDNYNCTNASTSHPQESSSCVSGKPESALSGDTLLGAIPTAEAQLPSRKRGRQETAMAAGHEAATSPDTNSYNDLDLSPRSRRSSTAASSKGTVDLLRQRREVKTASSRPKFTARSEGATKRRKRGSIHDPRGAPPQELDSTNNGQEGLEVASVYRGDGNELTMLRKKPSASSGDAAWLDSQACVEDGETVAVIRRVRAFAQIRTSAGIEGWLKNAFLVREDAQAQAGDSMAALREDSPPPSKKAKTKTQFERKPVSKRTDREHGSGNLSDTQQNTGMPGASRASVFRGDGSTSTMLRKRPTSSVHDSVWVDDETCVEEGATVTVLEHHRGGVFACVRTASGQEGWLKSAYLVVQNS